MDLSSILRLFNYAHKFSIDDSIIRMELKYGQFLEINNAVNRINLSEIKLNIPKYI